MQRQYVKKYIEHYSKKISCTTGGLKQNFDHAENLHTHPTKIKWSVPNFWKHGDGDGYDDSGSDNNNDVIYNDDIMDDGGGDAYDNHDS